MTDTDQTNLTAERDAIKARVDAAEDGAAKARITQDFGERLAHLEDRLKAETPPPSPEPPAST